MENIAIIGECMLELRQLKLRKLNRSRRCSVLPMEMSFGGDTMNTAIYMARDYLAQNVATETTQKPFTISYVSAVGDDELSDWLLDEWAKEGIDCSLIQRFENSVPGLYMINLNEEGERSFSYWRKRSPASRVFEDSGSVDKLYKKLSAYHYVYLSGISLAILQPSSRDRLIELLSKLAAQNVQIIFDGNYRPNLWRDVDEARQAYRRMYELTDIALPTLDDEKLLFGVESAEQVIEMISSWGPTEIIVKRGADGCLALSNGVVSTIEANPVVPVDTTAAGDSFNAAYISARLQGETAEAACKAGHCLAAEVIQHQGALMPV